jgi:hypothetical protein
MTIYNANAQIQRVASNFIPLVLPQSAPTSHQLL